AEPAPERGDALPQVCLVPAERARGARGEFALRDARHRYGEALERGGERGAEVLAVGGVDEGVRGEDRGEVRTRPPGGVEDPGGAHRRGAREEGAERAVGERAGGGLVAPPCLGGARKRQRLHRVVGGARAREAFVGELE